MVQTRRRINSVLAVTLFLVLLMAIFIATATFILKPSDGIIKSSFSQSKVAVIRLEGVIIDGSGVIKQLKKWGDDDSVKAIVLRIISPGGVVSPSQDIYREVIRTKKKKPVIASMGSVAASGGYYIAAACDKIVASPGTITGSIGVIMMFSNSQKLMEMIGIDTEVIKSGRFKDTGSSHRAMAEDEKAVMQSVVDDTYEQFITDVADGRNMDKEEVRKLSDGRIYTGNQAKKHNLIDELGDFEDAIKMAGDMVGIEKPDVVEDMDDDDFFKKFFGKDFEVLIPRNLFLPSGAYYLWSAW